jgi:hypothetical protein
MLYTIKTQKRVEPTVDESVLKTTKFSKFFHTNSCTFTYNYVLVF